MAIDFSQVGQSFSNASQELVAAAVKPISDKLNNQIDKIAIDARKKLAFENKVPESKVTNLQVAEYIANLPSKEITKQVADKMEYIGDSTRNGLIIGLGLIAIAMLVVGLKRK